MEKIKKNHLNFIFMFFKCFLIIICIAILAFWSNDSPAATIKIGEINPLSGRLAKQGIEIHQGVEVAIAEVNETGGIGGMRLELISRDDQSRPDVAISSAEALCAWEKVTALTGGYVDSLVGPVAAIAKKYKIPYVASASLQKELVQHNNPYFFRVSRLQGFVEPLCNAISYIFKPLHPAILYAATPGSTELAMDLKKCLQSKGINVSLIEKFRPGTPDFTPLIAKLAANHIDVIISGGFTPDHMLMIRQFKENKFSPKAYIGPFGIAYESFIHAMGKDSNYLYSTCAWNPGITEPGTEKASAAFVQKFNKMFHSQPNTTNMHGYTSTKALIEAMLNVKNSAMPITGFNLQKAMKKLDLYLPMEHLVFDIGGDPAHYSHVVVQIQKGELIVVFPSKRATGQPVYPMPTWQNRN